MPAEHCKTSWPWKELTHTVKGNGADALEHCGIVYIGLSQSRCSWPLPATCERISVQCANATPSDFVTRLLDVRSTVLNGRLTPI